MTYTEAVALYRTDKRAAIRAWDEEFQRRLAAYEAQPKQEQGFGASEVNRAFWGWQALVCDNCGKGPGMCDGVDCA